jgi:hypothetical protein
MLRIYLVQYTYAPQWLHFYKKSIPTKIPKWARSGVGLRKKGGEKKERS